MVIEKEFDKDFWKEFHKLPRAEQDEVRHWMNVLRQRHPVDLWNKIPRDKMGWGAEFAPARVDYVSQDDGEEGISDNYKVMEWLESKFGTEWEQWDRDDVILWNDLQWNDRRHRLRVTDIAAMYDVSQAAISKRLSFYKRLLNKILHETKLTRHQRSVADKYWIEGLTLEEIAQYGGNKGNHSETIRRVKERLEDRLKGEYDFLACRWIARKYEIKEETTGQPAFDWQWRCQFYDKHYLWVLRLRDLPDRTEIRFVKGIQPVAKVPQAIKDQVALEIQNSAVMEWWRRKGPALEWDWQREALEQRERLERAIDLWWLETDELVIQWDEKGKCEVGNRKVPYRFTTKGEAVKVVYGVKGKTSVRERIRNIEKRSIEQLPSGKWVIRNPRAARAVLGGNDIGKVGENKDGTPRIVEDEPLRPVRPEYDTMHPDTVGERYFGTGVYVHEYCVNCSPYPSTAHKTTYGTLCHHCYCSGIEHPEGGDFKNFTTIQDGRHTLATRLDCEQWFSEPDEKALLFCDCIDCIRQSDDEWDRMLVGHRPKETPLDHEVRDPWYAIKKASTERRVRKSPLGQEQAVLLKYKGYRKLIEWKLLPLVGTLVKDADSIELMWKRSEYQEWDIEHGHRWPVLSKNDVVLMNRVDSLHERDPRAEGIELPCEEWPEHILSCHMRSCRGCPGEGKDCQFSYEPMEAEGRPIEFDEDITPSMTPVHT